MTEILSTHDIAERDGYDQDQDLANMTATTAPDDAPIEFHIQMRGHTQRDMENLVIEAAAKQLLSRSDTKSVVKLIEDRCKETITQKANAVLEGITTEIIDQPVTPSFGDKKPVTMRELIGLTGREWLTARCDRNGNVRGTTNYDSYKDCTRIEWLVWQYVDRKFKDEIEKTTISAINEIRRELKAQHEKVIAEQMAVFRDALAKVSAK